MTVKGVSFNERVMVASLPSEEFKEAHHARRGPWVTAPQYDELWDGERRVFWEKELSLDELKEIMRFRRLVRYAIALQGINGFFGIKVPMPKAPEVIHELIKIGASYDLNDPPSESSSSTGSSPRNNPRSSVSMGSPRMLKSPEIISVDALQGSPRERARKDPTVDTLISLSLKSETFEIINPARLPLANEKPADKSSSPTQTEINRKANRMSASQIAAMKNAGKVIRVDSTKLGLAVHHPAQHSRKVRAQKRRRMHTLLQPWFGIVYFLVPLVLLASRYFGPFWSNVYYAWRENRVISTAIDIPWVFERMLRLPDIPFLHSTVYIGLFAVEMTTILYLLILFLWHVAIFFAVRPLVVSLSSSYTDRGAAAN